MRTMLAQSRVVPREQIEMLTKNVQPKTTTIETWWQALSSEDKRCVSTFQQELAHRLCLLHTFEDLLNWLCKDATSKSTCLASIGNVENLDERLRGKQVIMMTFLQERIPIEGWQLLARYEDTLDFIVPKYAVDHINAKNGKMYNWWHSLPKEHKTHVLEDPETFSQHMCIALKEDLKTFMDWLDIHEAAQSIFLEKAGPTIGKGGDMYHWFDLFLKVWTMKEPRSL